jgi:hypothetical protein
MNNNEMALMFYHQYIWKFPVTIYSKGEKAKHQYQSMDIVQVSINRILWQ